MQHLEELVHPIKRITNLKYLVFEAGTTVSETEKKK